MEEFAGLVIGLLIGLCIAYLSAMEAKNEGHIEVASGQVICELIETHTKTTKWNCSDVNDL